MSYTLVLTRAASSMPMHDTILVVDDDAAVRQAIRRVLEIDGFAVETAADGREALASAAQHPPALVVLDMSLPALGGSRVAAALRAAHGEALPILMITADAGAREKAAPTWPAAYLRKPFDLDALLTAVHGILDRA